MALVSSLTPVFVAVLCVVIAFVLRSFQKTKTTSKPDSKSTREARPWVDEDLKDDTEISSKDNGTPQRSLECCLYVHLP